MDEARRIASNIAKLPSLLGKWVHAVERKLGNVQIPNCFCRGGCADTLRLNGVASSRNFAHEHRRLIATRRLTGRKNWLFEEG
jgi:hypothetical protein